MCGACFYLRTTPVAPGYLKAALWAAPCCPQLIETLLIVPGQPHNHLLGLHLVLVNSQVIVFLIPLTSNETYHLLLS